MNTKIQVFAKFAKRQCPGPRDCRRLRRRLGFGKRAFSSVGEVPTPACALPKETLRFCEKEPAQTEARPLDRRRPTGGSIPDAGELCWRKDNVEIRLDVPVFGRGLFAARDFKPGDVVVEEVPFIRFNFDGLSEGVDSHNILRRFKLQDVSPEWVSLAAVICQAFPFAGRTGIKDPLETPEFKELTATRQPTEEEQKVLTEQILPVVRRLNETYTQERLFELYSKIASNAYGSGLYRIISFINHSCHPNVVWKPYQNRKNNVVSSSKTIQAVVPIRKGEQLFISYADYRGFDLSLLGNLGICCQNDPNSFEKTRQCLCCAGRDLDSLRQVFELSD